jgi:glycosyltransferase involved in cell wall biosynthesis
MISPAAADRTTPSNWLDGAAAVVLPAFVEHRPRRLLAALAAGVPVIATPQCGLGDLPGVIEVPAGDGEALMSALQAVIEDRDPVPAVS